MLRFDLLQTPEHDGQVLIEPPVAQWSRLIEQNVNSHAASVNLTLAEVPVSSVRDATRRRLWGTASPGPIIACGHQPEFIHPGVWAKHVVVNQVGRTLGLRSADLVVDNDAPRSTGLMVPALNTEGYLERRLIPMLGGATGAAYEGRPALESDALNAAARQVDAALSPLLTSAGEASALADYWRGFRSAPTPQDFVDQHLSGRAAIDGRLGATLSEWRVSRAFDGPFVADILLNLERFARAYNEALQAYRVAQDVRSPDRPLPDLKRTGDRLEAPFWVYPAQRPRRRLWVAHEADALALYADEEAIGRLSHRDLIRNAPATLAALSPWLIRPRALTLTLWARLLVCDFFVHGIGGAKYDRITDEIFRRYYRWEPPAYACVTATLRLPLPRHAVDAREVQAAGRRIRDLRFNPQRYVASPPRELQAEREQLIAESGRLREANADSAARRSVFQRIHEVNGRLMASDARLIGQFDREYARLQQQVGDNRVADSREFFYALQPVQRLQMLADHLREAATPEGR